MYIPFVLNIISIGTEDVDIWSFIYARFKQLINPGLVACIRFTMWGSSCSSTAAPPASPRSFGATCPPWETWTRDVFPKKKNVLRLVCKQQVSWLQIFLGTVIWCISKLAVSQTMSKHDPNFATPGRYEDKHGVRRFQGKKKELKSTQLLILNILDWGIPYCI